MIDFAIEATKYREEFFDLLNQWVSIPSLQDAATTSEAMPFEKKVDEALKWFEDLGVDITGTNLTSTQVTNILASKAGVLVENGAHFVNDGKGYIRFNLGTQKANVLEALERMEEVFKSL